MITIRMTLSLVLLSSLIFSACEESDFVDDQSASEVSVVELSEEAAALEREVMSHHVGDDEELGEMDDAEDQSEGPEWSEDMTPREFCAERAREAREESGDEMDIEEVNFEAEDDAEAEENGLSRAERACLQRARRAVRRRVRACLDFCVEEIDVEDSEDPRADLRACYEEECSDLPPPRRPQGERPQGERPQGERPQGDNGEQGERPQNDDNQ